MLILFSLLFSIVDCINLSASRAPVRKVKSIRRQMTMSSMTPPPPLCAGVDLGGTSIKFALVNADTGEVISRHEVVHDEDLSPETVVHRMHIGVYHILTLAGERLGQEFSADSLQSIGIGSPGKVSDGIVHGPANLNWNAHMPDGVPLAKMLRDRVCVDIPVRVVNDGFAALAGECWAGSAKGSRNAVIFTLGTGVGFAAIDNGKAVQGATSTIEGGHSIIMPFGRKCPCGQNGCMDTYCSASAVARRAQDDIQRTKEGRDLYEDKVREEVRAARLSSEEMIQSIDDMIRSSPLYTMDDFACKDVFASAKSGDAYAQIIIDETISYLTIGILNACRFFDTRDVLIAGGMINAGDQLLLPLNAKMQDMTWSCLPTPQEVKLASLGADTGII